MEKHSELLKKLTTQTGIAIVDAKTIVSSFLDIVKQSLIKNGRVKLLGLGTMKIVTTKDRAYHNPITGKKGVSKESKTIYFKKSKNVL